VDFWDQNKLKKRGWEYGDYKNKLKKRGGNMVII
jgi:hypothetical protein